MEGADARGTYCYITYLVRIESQSISGTVAN